ncbi:MAG: hypothetical protein ACSHX0_12875 [Akkermansiaceae bacterium]
MKFTNWLIASILIAGFSVLSAVVLFTMLPINGGILSLISSSLFVFVKKIKMKSFVFLNLGLISTFTVIGWISAENGLRPNPMFKWMFTEGF